MKTAEIADELREWLKNEDIRLAPYLRAWQGKDPYECLNNIRQGFQVMLGACVGLSLCVLVFLYYFKSLPTSGFCGMAVATGMIFIALFGVGFYIRRQEKKKLDHFIRAVQWCRIHRIPLELLGKKDWTLKTIEQGLRPFCETIQGLILPLEPTMESNKVFPKRHAETKTIHDNEKARVVNGINDIAPMFGNFKGVENALQAAFRIASGD